MEKFIASPSVRRLAMEKGIDLEEQAKRLGRSRLSHEDIDAGAGVAGAATGAGSLWDVDHSVWGPVREKTQDRFAMVAAHNLSASHGTIPAVTHHERADVSALEEFRHKVNKEKSDVKITLLSFVVMALARALRDFPEFNASLSANGDRLFIKEYVNIGIAVDTGHGLMVPVLRNVDRKKIREIAIEIRNMAQRAKQRKLRAEETGGGSMTITNLGGIGGIGFTPIINPPELAILGLSGIETVTVWDGDTPRPVPMLPLDMTYDHRVINGADAARFVEHLRAMIAEPRKLLF